MRIRLRARAVLPAAVAVTAAGCGGVQSALDPAGPDAARIAGLSWTIFALGAAVFLLVMVALAVPVVRSLRQRTEADAEVDDREPGHLGIWSGGVVLPVIVLAILMGISIPVARSTAPGRDADHQVTIDVVGQQFWWDVSYPDLGVRTANEIHVPVGEPVQFRLASADVIHSFWVPALHGKLDLTPGHVTLITMQADQARAYRGQCAEYCGLSHAQMELRIVAQERADFDRWVEEQRAPAQEPVTDAQRRGMDVFDSEGCAHCHQVRGHGAQGAIGPDLTHLASRETIAAGALRNTIGHLGGWVMNPQELKPGNRMPPSNLDGMQLQDLLAYLRSLE